MRFHPAGAHPLPRGLYRVRARKAGEDSCITASHLRFLTVPNHKLTIKRLRNVFCITPHQRKVILWLLNHDPALRPTAQELLKSELLPPPQMEESELHEVLQHTMANINGKAYRTMVGQLFAQNTSPVMDFTYDIDLHKVCGTT